MLSWRYFVLTRFGAAGPFSDPPSVGRVVARKVETSAAHDSCRLAEVDASVLATKYWSLLGELADRQSAGERICGTQVQRLKDLEDAMVERALLDPAPVEEATFGR